MEETMSTYRYSGQVRIRITYIDKRTLMFPNGVYRCFLRAGEHTATVIVGAPIYLSHAVDSPKAFDEAASSAISFVDYDSEQDQIDGKDFVNWGKYYTYVAGGNIHIGRSKNKAWSNE